MSQPPPIPLDYTGPHRQPPTRGSIGPLFLGIGLGSLLSFLAWVVGWQRFENNGQWMLVVVPGIKLAAGTVLVCIRGWRALGVGIFISLAVGFLIFFGACASHLRM
jgi:hypothetical protein